MSLKNFMLLLYCVFCTHFHKLIAMHRQVMSTVILVFVAYLTLRLTYIYFLQHCMDELLSDVKKDSRWP